ncbi:MAG: hypothetical protein Q8O34_07120 [Rhodocyclaceae bacterium]|nr:hypothetical protein [Rhodocyclaceae bacterium]
MNPVFMRFALAGVLGLAFSVSAWAQSSGGVVRGNTSINVNAGEINTIAVGSGNTAKTSIGSVKSSKSSTNVTVDVKNVSNVVVGRGKKGCINIGTKGADPDCK